MLIPLNSLKPQITKLLSVNALAMTVSMAFTGCAEVADSKVVAEIKNSVISREPMCLSVGLDISDSITADMKKDFYNVAKQNVSQLTEDGDTLHLKAIGSEGLGSKQFVSFSVTKTGKYVTDKKAKQAFSEQVDTALKDMLSQTASQTRLQESILSLDQSLDNCTKSGKRNVLILMTDAHEFSKQGSDINMKVTANVDVYMYGVGDAHEGAKNFLSTKNAWSDFFTKHFTQAQLKYYGNDASQIVNVTKENKGA